MIRLLRACKYCGRIHSRDFDCGRKPDTKRRYQRSEAAKGRYSRAFAEKSKEIKERSLWLCAYCLAHGKLCHDQLETHHIEKLELHPELLLDDRNLVCLCAACHRAADKGKISPIELTELAEERDNGSPRGLNTLSQ